MRALLLLVAVAGAARAQTVATALQAQENVTRGTTGTVAGIGSIGSTMFKIQTPGTSTSAAALNSTASLTTFVTPFLDAKFLVFCIEEDNVVNNTTLRHHHVSALGAGTSFATVDVNDQSGTLHGTQESCLLVHQ